MSALSKGLKFPLGKFMNIPYHATKTHEENLNNWHFFMYNTPAPQRHSYPEDVVTACKIYMDDDWCACINGYLRGNPIHRNEGIEDSTLQQYIDSIDKGMVPLQQDTILYRGLTSYPKGGIQLGFSSTTTDREVAELYGEYLLILSVPKGTPHIDMESLWSNPRIDCEILLARNIHIEILKTEGNTFAANVTYKHP